MITITEKEKQYLLSIDIKEFINSLYSKSIFYELLKEDFVLRENLDFFNSITVIALYNLVLNIIYSNLEEALGLKHILYNKHNKNKVKVCILNSKRPFIRFETNNKNTSFLSKGKELEYIVFLEGTKCILQDSLFTLNPTQNRDHYFSIYPNNVNEFICKMLILYEDFVDNIPI